MKFIHDTIRELEDLIIHKAGRIEDEIIALSERLKNRQYRDNEERGKINERLKLAKYQRYLIYGKAHHNIMRHNTALDIILNEDKGLLVDIGRYVSSLQEARKHLEEYMDGNKDSLLLAERSLTHARKLAPRIEKEILHELSDEKKLE